MSDLRAQLLEIRAITGKLTPEAVVDAARSESHPLHARFEWDDAIAGERYRLSQGAELIRSVKVEYRDPGGKPQEIRAFVAIRGESPRADYTPIEEAVADPFTQKLLMQEFRREWATFKAKYEQLEAFVAVIQADVA